ncbi:3945_t:CDS:2 [Funneliformis geosporum]|uniref:3945_t:CDS:1 n=1 Tax=Funneliformis geosporum TaxID=1117311 RepID=A0A9W4WQZ7_9GLOM|nr:3945_t:CDS:2 [Funneliformis geosporum]
MDKSQTTLLSFQTCEVSSVQGFALNQPNNMDDLNSISIKRPPYPPSIDTDYLVENLLKRKSKNPKMPNEFFIYRAALVKELKANNYKIKMTNLSTLASRSWSQESPQVKSEYRKLARETESQYLKIRSIEMSNTINNSGKISDQKKRISKKVVPPSLNFISSTSNPTKSDSIHEHDHSKDSITVLPDIGDIVDVTMSEINDDVTTTIMRSTLGYQQYPSQIWQQPPYEYELSRNDFMLMEDNSIFVYQQFHRKILLPFRIIYHIHLRLYRLRPYR